MVHTLPIIKCKNNQYLCYFSISFLCVQRRQCYESTIVSEGFKGGTRGSPLMPRDVSLSDSKYWNGGQNGLNRFRIDFSVCVNTLWNQLYFWMLQSKLLCVFVILIYNASTVFNGLFMSNNQPMIKHTEIVWFSDKLETTD